MNFKADKVSIRGPKVDGSYVVCFEVGEYQRENIAPIITMPEGVVEVTIKMTEDKTDA